MQSKLTEFEYLKRKKRRKKTKKTLVNIFILFVILFLSYFIYSNNYHIRLKDNISGIFKVFKRGSGYPIKVNMMAIKDKTKIDNTLLLLDEADIYLFNKQGYRMLYMKHSLDNPRVVSNDSKAIVFEHLGKKLKVYSKTSLLFAKELDNIIYNINIFEDNKIAVVKNSNRYISSLEIWDSKYSPIFRWDSTDKYITMVDFAKNNKNFVVSSLEVKGVEYVSTISFFNINKDKKISEIELKDEMVLSLTYENNYVYVIGINGSYIIDNKGKLITKYDYEGRSIKAYNNDFYKGELLIFDNYNKAGNNSIVLLDKRLRPILEKYVEGKIKDVSGNGKKVYILTDENMLEFSSDMKKNRIFNIDSGINDIIAVKDRLYQISTSKINMVK